MTENPAGVLPLTVGQVAERFGVTVRTLHHYDEIDLVVPSERTAAGYRLYTDEDLTCLQNVVVYRRLGFGLDAIALILAAPDSVVDHLQRQRAAVMSRLGELTQLVDAIDAALETTMNDKQMTPAQMRDLFGDSYDESYQAEAEQRWGDTDAWRQSQARTATYSAQDWKAVKAEGDAVNEAFAAAYDAGLPADSPQAAAAAELHRSSINRFYDCTHQMQANLAQMYVADPRFAAHYDAVRPGLAHYLHDAIIANAQANGVSDPSVPGEW